ncbi:TetR family transcriptional regulator [Streptomyces sp. NPDC050145]|uniref:TetR family transcriptional regulator n=1 Tax=Streptomyces sp. NPDC050145 TaxID=3365602 RepID=UPI0037A2044C
MGRWEPNARGRLAEAALRLYAEQGFDRTTVAEIAASVGVTERTFFRHFTDKREVLFYGAEAALDLVTRAVAGAPESASPMVAVSGALQAFGAFFQEDPQRARNRDAVVSASAELRERELVKLDAFSLAMAGALRERGVAPRTATLAAEAGTAAFKIAYAEWMAIGRSGEKDRELPGLFLEVLAELTSVLDATRD